MNKSTQLTLNFDTPKDKQQVNYSGDEFEAQREFYHCPECETLCDIHTSKRGITDYICPKCGNHRIRYVQSNLSLFRLSPLEKFLILWQNTYGNQPEYKEYLSEGD